MTAALAAAAKEISDVQGPPKGVGMTMLSIVPVLTAAPPQRPVFDRRLRRFDLRTLDGLRRDRRELKELRKVIGTFSLHQVRQS